MAAAPAAMNTPRSTIETTMPRYSTLSTARGGPANGARVKPLADGPGGHGEPRHDDDEDEEVVDAEAVLGDVPGDELAARRPGAEDEQPDGEEGGQRDVEDHPRGGLLHRHGFLAPGDDDQVEDHDRHETQGGQCPDQW